MAIRGHLCPPPAPSKDWLCLNLLDSCLFNLFLMALLSEVPPPLQTTYSRLLQPFLFKSAVLFPWYFTKSLFLQHESINFLLILHWHKVRKCRVEKTKQWFFFTIWDRDIKHSCQHQFGQHRWPLFKHQSAQKVISGSQWKQHPQVVVSCELPEIIASSNTHHHVHALVCQSSRDLRVITRLDSGKGWILQGSAGVVLVTINWF